MAQHQLSAGAEKLLVSLLEKRGIRPHRSTTWHLYPAAVQTLERVSERWAIFFDQHVGSHFDFVVRPHGHEPIVEGGVMDLAHGDAVRYDWFAPLSVTAYVCGVQQFAVTQTTQRAAVLVGR